jgi:MoaA/NifB/PqqE/SkfB family radical SAM enzyme
MVSSLGKLVILSRWLFTNQATTAAIDITHRCNLTCAHCYWWKQEHPREMDDGGMIRFMWSLRAKGLRAAILYGGEPTLRPEVCRAAGKIFDATLAFTNGTNGFPVLPNGQWILSLDGPKAINDAIRGKGVYDLAVQNVRQAARPPIVHMTISRLNVGAIEDFVKKMLALPVKGMGFSFLTPNVGEGEEVALTLPERDRAVAELLRLRSRYGNRIGFTSAMAHQLQSNGAFREWNRYAACPVSRRVRCYQSDGTGKACTYGDDADCSRCGCAAVVAFRGAFNPLDGETITLILGLVFPGFKRAGNGTYVSLHRRHPEHGCRTGNRKRSRRLKI